MHMSFVPDTQNKEFQDALNLIQYTRQSVFLTGESGYGKVYLSPVYLRTYQEETRCAGSYRNCRHQCGGKHAAQFLQTAVLSSAAR
mgnify:CR=1 FL=1